MTAITRHLPFFIKDPAVAIIGQKCYTSLIENLDFSDTECLKYALSKGLGIGIVVGGSIVKVPQLLIILKARSARGLSLPAYVLETLSYAIALTYSARNGFAFSTYGENFFLTLQNILITFLIILYRSSSSPPLSRKQVSSAPQLALAATIAASTAATLLLVPTPILSLLQLSTIPLGIFSKIPQILQNSRAQSTGQLSGFAVFSQIAGCLARIFTTATEVQDPLILWSFVGALILNLVLGAQMIAYRGTAEDVIGAKEKAEPASYSYPREKVEIVIPSNPPVSPSPPPGGRRWARKVD